MLKGKRRTSPHGRLKGCADIVRRWVTEHTVMDMTVDGLALATLCVAVIEWVLAPPGTPFGVGISLAYCCALATLPWHGHYASWAILIAGTVSDVGVVFDPEPTGPNMIWGLLLAMVTLGRSGRFWECPVAISLALASATYATLLYPDLMGYSLPYGIMNFGVGLLCAYLVGVSARYRDAQRLQRRTRRRIEQVGRNLLMALTLHDAVSGNLTRILVLSERMRREHPLEYGRYGIGDVSRFARDALHETHQIIDILQNPREIGSGEVGALPLMRLVESAVADHDSRLRGLGYRGGSIVQGENTLSVDGRGYEFVALLREVYANIERHCDPECSPYRVRVIFHDGMVELIQGNGLERTKTRIMPPKSGRGLKLHRNRIQAYGGVLHANPVDGEWRVYCSMPLQ